MLVLEPFIFTLCLIGRAVPSKLVILRPHRDTFVVLVLLPRVEALWTTAMIFGRRLRHLGASVNSLQKCTIFGFHSG